MKNDRSWNPKSETILRRGVDAMRAEPVDMTGADRAVRNMADTPSAAPRAVRRTGLLPLRYLVVGGVAASLGMLALWPKSSSAAMLRDVAKAVRDLPSRYERVYKPDSSGALKVYLELWGAPGKSATHFIDGAEFRQNGKLAYSYWPDTNRQRIQAAEACELDPVSVADFAQFPLIKVVREGGNLRYECRMAPGRQDLVVDAKSKLPIERDVLRSDGSVMEVHEYHFYAQLDDRLFDPDVKPGVPIWDIPRDRADLALRLAGPGQTDTVAGLRIVLHAVIVDSVGFVGAVVSGGDPRSTQDSEALQVDGRAGRDLGDVAENTTFAGKVGFPANTLRAGGHVARLEHAFFGRPSHVPDRFVLKVPVWILDRNRTLKGALGKTIGTDSRFVGWASFEVVKPLRTEQIENVLPNYVLPPAEVETGSAATPRVPPAARRN